MGNIFDLFNLIEKKKEPLEVLPVSSLVVGLGNPGKEYMKNRHNAGFLCAELLAMQLGGEFNKAKFKSVYADVTKNGKRFLIMKPQTYMNNSGEAVREAMAFYKLNPEQVIVISDDISLDIGKQRVKRKGSDGGQKGRRSIIYHLSSDQFPRVKAGVGKKPHPDYDLADWVLGKFPDSDRENFNKAAEDAANALVLLLDGKFDEAMCKFN